MWRSACERAWWVPFGGKEYQIVFVKRNEARRTVGERGALTSHSVWPQEDTFLPKSLWQSSGVHWMPFLPWNQAVTITQCLLIPNTVLKLYVASLNPHAYLRRWAFAHSFVIQCLVNRLQCRLSARREEWGVNNPGWAMPLECCLHRQETDSGWLTCPRHLAQWAVVARLGWEAVVPSQRWVPLSHILPSALGFYEARPILHFTAVIIYL